MLLVMPYYIHIDLSVNCCVHCDLCLFFSAGELPIEVSERVESFKEATPPPLPPKVDDAEDASLLPPKPKPRVGSLKQAPPRPPKTM